MKYTTLNNCSDYCFRTIHYSIFFEFLNGIKKQFWFYYLSIIVHTGFLFVLFSSFFTYTIIMKHKIIIIYFTITISTKTNTDLSFSRWSFTYLSLIIKWICHPVIGQSPAKKSITCPVTNHRSAPSPSSQSPPLYPYTNLSLASPHTKQPITCPGVDSYNLSLVIPWTVTNHRSAPSPSS